MKKTISILSVLFLFLIINSCGQKDYKRINEVGGIGVTYKIEDTNVTINDNPQVRIYVTAYSQKEEPFKSSIKTVVSRFSLPQIGDLITVKYDPKDIQQIIWVEEGDVTKAEQTQIYKIEETIE